MTIQKRQDTRDRVIGLIAEVCAIDRSGIADTASLQEDLGLDSVDIVSLILALEDEFGGVISDAEAAGLGTVGDVITYINNRLAGAS